MVGERTFGKGSVQNLYPNNEDDSQLKLTVARYLTPGDQSIQSVGVPPDVLLEQSIVETHTDKETNKTDPIVTLFWRERLTREADLDHHLGDALPPADAPVYAVRTLNHLDVEENTRRDRRDLSKDNEVQLCRELILAAPPKANRAELLAAAGKVVTTTQRAQSDEIRAAFQSFGIDWTAGDQPAQPQLTVSLDLGPDAVLLAGEAQEELIYVKVTNNGPAPVFQVMAIADSTASWLDGGEFFFGRIDPGQTKVWPKRVQLPEGYRDSVEQVTFKLQDGQRRVLGEEDELVRTVGQLLPRLSYAWSATDAPAVKGTKGDGDGGHGEGRKNRGGDHDRTEALWALIEARTSEITRPGAAPRWATTATTESSFTGSTTTKPSSPSTTTEVNIPRPSSVTARPATTASIEPKAASPASSCPR